MLACEVVDVIQGHSFRRTENISCPLCGKYREPRAIPVAFGMTAMVAECQDCRLAYQTPRPTLEASLAYMNWRWCSSDKYVGDQESQMRRHRKRIKWVKQFVDKPRRVLDFGAGAGSFVRAALEQGWDAVGIEQCNSAIARAREYYDIELLERFGKELYNVVTMWDVVEHLREPVETLKSIREHLTEDGLLFIETGNFEYWRRVLEKDKWGLYLFDHQFYFSPGSLRQVLRHAGYEDFYLLNFTRRPPPVNLVKIGRHPVYSLLSWLEWVKAKVKWPKHGDMKTIVVVTGSKAALNNIGVNC